MNLPSRIIIGDVLDGLRSLNAGSVHCCVTSPPYFGLRDYGVEGQIGLEATPDEFVAKMVEVFREVRRVLRDDGTCFLNLGDSYNSAASGQNGMSGTLDGGKPCGGNGTTAGRRPLHRGLKPKDLCMMPWRVALALQADGWWIRSVICWAKKSPMPESCRDRPTSSWEPIFLLTKSERYFYDAEAVKEKSETTVCRRTQPTDEYRNGKTPSEVVGRPVQRGGKSLAYAYPNGIPFRNLRNVWHLGPEPYRECHFATFPTEIPRRAIKAGTSEKGCCPKCGAGWVRQIEAWHENPGNRTTNGPRHKSKNDGELGSACYDQRLERRVRTLGWSPSCECSGGEPVPCLVLDPFLGSGTTVAVARELGRHGVGIELNPAYAELARVRIGKAEKPQTFVDHRAPAPAGLFAEAGN